MRVSIELTFGGLFSEQDSAIEVMQSCHAVRAQLAGALLLILHVTKLR